MSIPYPDPDLNPGLDPWLDPTHFPADKGLELALLGAILLEPPVMDQLDFLVPGDFYYEHHQTLFARMRMLWEAGSSIDVVLVADRDLELLAVCNDAYTACPSALLAPDYARKVKDLAQKRRFGPILSRAAEMSMNGVDFESIRDYLLDELDRTPPISPLGRFAAWADQERTLADALRPRERLVWLIELLISRGSVNLFYGLPGDFKTMLLQYMALCLATGRPFLPKVQTEQAAGRTFATRACKTLYLDYDQGQTTTDARFEALARGMGLEADTTNLIYASFMVPRPNFTEQRDLDAFVAYVMQREVAVVIIDGLATVMPVGMKMVDETVRAVLDGMRYIASRSNATFIVAHHPIKNNSLVNRTAGLDAYGSVHLVAALDMMFSVERQIDHGQRTNKVLIRNTKARQTEPLMPFGAEFWSIPKDDGSGEMAKAWFTAWAPTAQNGADLHTMLWMAVHHVLGDKTLTQQALIEAVREVWPDLHPDSAVPGEKVLRSGLAGLVEDKPIVRVKGEKNAWEYRLV